MLFSLSPAPSLPDEATVTRAILELVGRERERHHALAQGKRRVPVLTSRAVAGLVALSEDHPLVESLLAQIVHEAFVAGFGTPTTIQAAQAIARRLLQAA
ncbi:hypothetical protein DEIPH_ctg014orf0027 [Deinococcus phoenicis]|uniref:Uncharacterized protein n=1 Tax=Deinococcus phoenicis TaxID=1476583 RepID=A0A016QSL1_9DEIO|nr:hypothetical protein [Deinococcus phoenicis]EYB68897.1 hypothetical protein DEIPH_ctg014orf0027 [Deinococcus phoenicis]